MWLSLNMIGAFVEIWAKSFSKIEFWTRFQNKLSRPSYMRILALVGLPPFLLAVLSNLYFLSGNEQIGNELIRRVFSGSNHYALHLIFSLYCGAMVSIGYNKMAGDLTPLHRSKLPRKEPKKSGMKFKL